MLITRKGRQFNAEKNKCLKLQLNSSFRTLREGNRVNVSQNEEFKKLNQLTRKKTLNTKE